MIDWYGNEFNVNVFSTSHHLQKFPYFHQFFHLHRFIMPAMLLKSSLIPFQLHSAISYTRKSSGRLAGRCNAMRIEWFSTFSKCFVNIILKCIFQLFCPEIGVQSFHAHWTSISNRHGTSHRICNYFEMENIIFQPESFVWFVR